MPLRGTFRSPKVGALLLAPALLAGIGLTFASHGAADTSTSAATLPTNNAPTVISPRVVGGEPTPDYIGPSLGWVKTKGRLCSGTFLDDRHLLTAAHCITDNNLKPLPLVDVTVGHSPLADRVGKGWPAGQLTPHPDYITDDVHDIAIITLRSPLPHVQPVTLDPDPVLPNTPSLVVGWGLTYQNSLPIRALSGRVNTFSDALCTGEETQQVGKFTYVGYYGFNPTNALCAGGLNEEDRPVDACSGDSGGPLFTGGIDALSSTAGEAPTPMVGAVVSRGYGCGDDQPDGASLPDGHIVAGWYTRVHPYLSWIDEVIASTTPPEPVWSDPAQLTAERVKKSRWSLSADIDAPDQIDEVTFKVSYRKRERTCQPTVNTQIASQGCDMVIPKRWKNWRLKVSVAYVDGSVTSTVVKRRNL